MEKEISPVDIGGRLVGPGRPALIVAEMSANHRQSYDLAAELVQLTREAGADAVKVQTYTPDTMTIDCDRPEFRHGPGSLWAGRTLHELYREAYMPWEWQPRLKEVAESLGLIFFSTAYDATSVDFLRDMGVPAIKISSFELVDLPLIEYAAAAGKPLILSTGMATRAEIEAAVRAAREAGCRELVLLQCTSAYPAEAADANLRAIPGLSQEFGVPAGYSDHSMEIAIPVAAVTLGACLIERHFSVGAGGPDGEFSTRPGEWRRMVRAIRTVESALGTPRFGPVAGEGESLKFRRSLYAVRDLAAGETATTENVRAIRPSGGLAAGCLPRILGTRVRREVKRGTPLAWDLFDPGNDAESV